MYYSVVISAQMEEAKMTGKTRQGKVVTAGHSTRIPGLMAFLQGLGNSVPEIESLRIGSITPKGGRLHRGRLSMRVTRYYQVGSVRTGFMCVAGEGGMCQEVVIVASSGNLAVVLERLRENPQINVSDNI